MPRKLIFLLLFILFYAGGITAQESRVADSPLKIGKNYRIYPSNVNQTEVFIVKNPLDQNTFFTSCNTLTFVPFFISEGIYTTNNGGSSWQGNDTCTGYPISYHGGDVGIAIDKNGTYLLTRLGRSPFVGLFSHYSTDEGKTWSEQKVISTDDLERAALTTDLIPTSQFFGKSYAAWVTFAPPFPVMFSVTENGGQLWSKPIQVNNPPNRSAGGDLAIGPQGEIYLCWAGVTDVSPFKEIHVGFAASLNSGSTWKVTENAFPISGISGILTEKSNIRVNSLPGIAVDTTHGPRGGWIYVVTCQKGLLPAGNDPDIILNRSNDGGLTWSSAIRVNQDALNNGKIQYFPSVHVDQFGGVDILFYDDRTTTSDSVGIFLARSMDGGNTWLEYELGDHHFKPKPIGGLGQGYQGDNIDLTSNDKKIFPMWMDNYSGIYQIWSVPVDFSEVNAVIDQGNITRELQNFPNPFSGKTEIRYNISKSGQIRLEVYSFYGNDCKILYDGWQTAGPHSLVVDMESFSSGVYICRLFTEQKSSLLKIVKLP